VTATYQFHAAGGIGFVIRELLAAGLAHDLPTVWEGGLAAYAREPYLEEGLLLWRDAPAASLDTGIVRPAAEPFSADGGLKLATGNLGRAIVKVSAVKPEHRVIAAPARVFHDQDDVVRAFKAGELERDVVVVLRFQGPRANGMPELHKLTPSLAVLQDRGYRVALVTDGRMSGASGKVPAAIHVWPEAACGGAIARVRDGDPVLLDANAGRLEVQVAAEEWAQRALATDDLQRHASGMGRELFAAQRAHALTAEQGAVSWLP